MNRKFTIWLVQLPLWRFLLVYFLAGLAVSYAVSVAGDWGLRHFFGMPSNLTRDESPAEHILQAATLALLSCAFRPGWRRQLARRQEHSQHAQGSSGTLPG